MKENIRQLLKRFWGFSQFRPLQEDIILSVLSGKDTLALLPTGGGKSLCYQVPALATEGICIVVSPLIALMKDQADGLERKGIKCITIFSGMSQREIDIAFDNAAYGNYKFLFLSPERLETDLFRERAIKLNVNLIAIDEAHCISDWGYDFRPSYLKIAELREFFPKVPLLALTATATPEVKKDITEKLAFGADHAIFTQSFDRKNLIYAVLNEEDKQGRLLKLFQKVPGSALVYAGTRNNTRTIAEHLVRHGLQAGYYHAGLTHEERTTRQESWKKGLTRIMVCTNAFGMGIDKPDVRLVVHYDMPQSLEAYYQEAGRAGRDNQRSFAISMFNPHDKIEMEFKARNTLPQPKEVKQVYQAMGNYFQLPVGSGIGQSYDLNLQELTHKFELQPVKVYNSLKLLEQAGYLAFTESVFLPSRLMVKVDNHSLYSFEIANRSFEPLIKILLRSYGGCFDNYVQIQEDIIAHRLFMKEKEVGRQLKKLHEAGLIDYHPRKSAPQVTYLRERLHTDNLLLDSRYIAGRQSIFAARIEAVTAYALARKCRGRILLAYFGEVSLEACGHCDICLKAAQGRPEDIQKRIRQHLAAEEMETSQLLSLMNDFEENAVIQELRTMADNNIIRWREGRYLSMWK